ncbi:MAG: flagellin lysine-N-methylase [Syntrophomonadaceae bacterium]|jgi:lysine-N-methylase
MPKHYLVPDYILEYKCACCTECCKRWRIIIDRDTVEKYDRLAAEDEELSAMLQEGLQKDKTGKAAVRLKNIVKKTIVEENGEQKEILSVDDAVCPFLNGEGLCAIQKRHGIGALSDTCKIFPRTIFKTERGLEMAFTYACKTAAKTLKKKHMVEFFQDPPGFDFPELHSQYGRIGDVLERKKQGKSSYFEVEALLIDIMQFRDIDIDTRFILAGIVIDKLKNGDVQSIRKYLQNLDDDLINQLMSLPSQPVFMMKLIKEAVDKRLFSRITEQDMNRLINLAYIELKLLDQPAIADEKVQRFLDAYNKYYKPGLSDTSHVYENYFVNFVFSKKYYTHKYMDAYFLMIFFYILIRFFAVCVCLVQGRNVDEDIIVDVISAIERSIGHNAAYYEDVLRLIKEGGYHRLPYVISLVNL